MQQIACFKLQYTVVILIPSIIILIIIINVKQVNGCSIRQAARHRASIMAQRKVGKNENKSLGSIQKDEETSRNWFSVWSAALGKRD